MADLNKVFLMGNLTFDPELRRTPSGTAVSELRLATTRSWTGREGERREETLFIDVTVWDRQAETCCQYLRKGSPVHVEGSLKMDTWDDKTTGEKRSKVKVQAERVQFLERRDSSAAGASAGAASAGYDELAPPTRERDAAPRRPAGGPAADSRGGGGGGNGAPSRGFSGPSGGPAPRRPAPEPEPTGDDDEDIPF